MEFNRGVNQNKMYLLLWTNRTLCCGLMHDNWKLGLVLILTGRSAQLTLVTLQIRHHWSATLALMLSHDSYLVLSRIGFFFSLNSELAKWTECHQAAGPTVVQLADNMHWQGTISQPKCNIYIHKFLTQMYSNNKNSHWTIININTAIVICTKHVK